jgi:quercetin dioxygenase-like cupin family protein
MRTRTTFALGATALAAGVLAGNVMATPPAGVTTMILGKSLFSEFQTATHTLPADTWQAQLRTHGDSDVYAVDNRFDPGGSTGWHSHPGPSLILVLSGTVTNYDSSDPSCTPHDYAAGQGFLDPAGVVHEVRNNSTTASAEVLAVQLLPHGSTRRIDEPQPSNCTS